MKHTFHILILLTLLLGGEAFALPIPHNATDTIKANSIISSLSSAGSPFGSRIVSAARSLQDATLDKYYRQDSLAKLRINLDEVTPLTFVNNVIALAKASEKSGNPDWRNYAVELENISCRRGENDGFASIMFHGADWIADNIFRGNIKEMTENYPSSVIVRTKSLDDLTRNRSQYAALSDSSTFEKVRMTEMGYRNHRIPTLKKEAIQKKEILDDLKDGDIIILVPSGDGVDIYDMGFIAMRDDGPHLIHLSPRSLTVVEEEENLLRYMKLMTKYFQGFRLLRVQP